MPNTKRTNTANYREKISSLIDCFPLPIDKNIIMSRRQPTSANSEFLTNKEQGDWAERLVVKAINDFSPDYVALPYGRSDSIAAGDPGFAEFYKAYQDELNDIGKKPDVLIFRKKDAPTHGEDFSDASVIGHAIAAIEVRSSSFLCEKFKSAMSDRMQNAKMRCADLIRKILEEPYGDLLKEKNPFVFQLLKTTNTEAFRELSFRNVSWSSSESLRTLSAWLKELKSCIKQLQKRDNLSITPKLEDLALVNRWISKFNVPHYYLQVFFDKAYIISFEKILSICCDSKKEGIDFSFETDVKNQGKTTAKINIDAGEPIIGRIDMPSHFSAMKELDKGRLLFYVKFDGGQGYLDEAVFRRVVTP